MMSSTMPTVLIVTMSMIVMSSMIRMCVMTMISMSSMPLIMSSTHLMELYTICCILILTIESNMGKIVPNRESYSIENIRKKELVEHEEYSKWQNNILVSDHISKYS